MVKNIATVEVTGWLNDVKHFQWGSVLKVSVGQRKKNAQGEWETVDKTVYYVTTSDQVRLDGVKQVTVTGRISGTQTFPKLDGSTGAAVKVRAESIQPAVADAGAPMQAVWPDVKLVDESAPF